jgi:pimeloyl-ACP methyl ester carboxylesterase
MNQRAPELHLGLPCPDAGLSAYADRVLEEIGTRRVVLVAQSLGGFTAPLVCARAPVSMLVFVNAMIPVPGETAGEWWDNTGSTAARIAAANRGGYGTDFDLATYFLHDLSAETIRQGEAHERPEAEIVFGEPCRFAAWPDIPIHVIAGGDDRFFPLDLQRPVAQARLDATVEKLPGGHLLALSNPRGIADKLLPRTESPRSVRCLRPLVSRPRAAPPASRSLRSLADVLLQAVKQAAQRLLIVGAEPGS